MLRLLCGHADRVAEHASTFLETSDIGPDCYNLTGSVLSKDGGIVEGKKGERLEEAVDLLLTLVTLVTFVTIS